MLDVTQWDHASTTAAKPAFAKSVYARPMSGRFRQLAWSAFRRTLPVTGPDDRRGGWIHTYTGGRVWPMDPRTEDASVVDIAHHLSMKARFSGACREMLSVAQHGVQISEYLEEFVPEATPAEHFAALHHDNTESFLPDVVTPVKPYLPFWRTLESVHERAFVVDAFQIDPKSLKFIKPYDKRIVADEAASLLVPSPHPWDKRPQALGIAIQAWPPALAEARFLARHYHLLDVMQSNKPIQ